MSPSDASARSWRAYLVLGLLVFLAHAILTGGHLQSPDEELMFRTAESMALRGRTSILPLEYDFEARALLVPPTMTFATVPGRNGTFQAQYLPLQPLLTTPLIWLAEATRGALAEPFFRTLPESKLTFSTTAEFAWPRAVVVTFFNPLVAALTAIFLARLGAFVTGGDRRAGMMAAILWAFGTIGWAHSRTYFTEPLAGLFALLALDALLRWMATPLVATETKRRLRHLTLMGLWIAAGNWTRMDSPAIAAGLLGVLIVGGEVKRVAENMRRSPRARVPWVEYAIPIVIAAASYGAIAVYNHWRFDPAASSLVGGGYGDQEEGVKFSTPILIGLHGLLMSPGKGVFFFSPALLLAVWGWARVPASRRWVALAVLGGFLPFFIAMAKWQNWDGGWCWGPRHIVQMHAPLMLGAAFLYGHAQTRLRRLAAVVALVIGGGVQLYGSSQSAMYFYHEMFRTPEDGLVYTLPYREVELATINQFFRIEYAGPNGSQRVPATSLPSPLVDSLYLPQHSQWNGYAVLWNEGVCDWWLWNAAR